MKITTRALVSGVALSGATLAMALGSIDRAQAATISTLFNTGVDSTGVPTVGSDNNYTLTGSSFGNVPRAIAIGTFPASAYNTAAGAAGQGDDTKSAWIGPNNNNLEDKVGQYTYLTSFDLSGLDASTASIQGKWNTDNSGLKLILNGTDVAAANPGFGTGFSNFTLTSGFNSGMNTLAFVVDNADRGDGAATPTALRVEFTSTFAKAIPTATEVPEPSDLAGTAFAFGSVVLLKRKFGKKQSISKQIFETN